MSNKYLAREDAPFGSETWELLDDVMVEAAKSQLVGRRLLHVDGPYGLGVKAVPLRDTELESSGLIASDILPVLLIQEAFTLGTRDLASFERERISLDLGAVAEAVLACARREDDLVFNGAPGVSGLLTVKGANEMKLSAWDEVGAAATDIVKAITLLDDAGFHGPYALALTPARFNLLLRLYPRGNQTELDHVRGMVTEGVFKAPILESGGVLLASGRQFASIVLGQDMSIGYVGPAGPNMEFSVSESLTVRVPQPAAVCALKG